MSQHNRHRRNRVACLKCREPFDARLIAAANAMSAANGKASLHVCGICKALHTATEGGGLRLLTPAEEFRMRMNKPKTFDLIDAMECPRTDGPVMAQLPAEDELP